MVGGLEVLILVTIILLFFGASRIPQLGRSLGSSIREFRQAIAGASGREDEAPDRNESEEQVSQNVAVYDNQARAEDETMRGVQRDS